MKLMMAKGVRDFPAEKKIARQQVIDKIIKSFEVYGFSPIESPILERYDVLASKYTGGAEILKETFRLFDQGKRELALRYDLTVPLCRFIAMNPNLKMPFKRYQIGNVFRDGPVKAGRYREFWQCDTDIVGCREMSADAEIINLALDIFEKLNLDIIIKVNNRKILNSIIRYAEIKKEKAEEVMLTIDKLEKYGKDVVKKELKEKGIAEKSIKKIFEFILLKGSFESKIRKLKKRFGDDEGLKKIEELFNFIDSKNVELDVSLARGLAYYTGTVFEVFLKKGEIKSAIAAGGRYDKMISNLLSSEKKYPAVGISFGLDVITDVINQKEKKTVTEIYIIPIGTLKESLKIAKELRKAGIKTDIDLIGRGPSKNLNYVNSMKIPFVLLIGEDELKQNKVKLRDMKAGQEKLITMQELEAFLNKT